MRRKFKMVEDGGSGKWVWLSEKINHGDWPFRFAIVLEDTADWGDDVGFHYHLSIYPVSPGACRKKWGDVCKSMGMSISDFMKLPHMGQCQVVLDYGIRACLWQETGDKGKALLQQAKEKMLEVDMLFGLYMDKIANGCGATGWHLIRGELWPKKS